MQFTLHPRVALESVVANATAVIAAVMSSAPLPNAAANRVVNAFQENHARSKFKRLNTARIVRFASKVEPQADTSPSPRVRRGAGVHNVRRGRVPSPSRMESPEASAGSPATTTSPSVHHWGRPRRSSREGSPIGFARRPRGSREGSEEGQNESPATRKRRVSAESTKKKGRIIDTLNARSHTLHSLKSKVRQQRRLSIALICLSLLGIALMITELEARIELAWSLTVLDVLRAIGVAITLAATVLIVAYNRNHALIQQQCGASRGAWVHVGSVLLESIIMLAGVVPPFVEIEYELTLLNAPLDVEAFKPIHLDSIGLLMLLRHELTLTLTMTMRLSLTPTLDRAPRAPQAAPRRQMVAHSLTHSPTRPLTHLLAHLLAHCSGCSSSPNGRSISPGCRCRRSSHGSTASS